jgi:hypothetical protein
MPILSDTATAERQTQRGFSGWWPPRPLKIVRTSKRSIAAPRKLWYTVDQTFVFLGRGRRAQMGSGCGGTAATDGPPLDGLSAPHDIAKVAGRSFRRLQRRVVSTGGHGDSCVSAVQSVYHRENALCQTAARADLAQWIARTAKTGESERGKGGRRLSANAEVYAANL